MSHGLAFDVEGMKALARTRREYLSFVELDQIIDAVPDLCDRVIALERSEALQRKRIAEGVRTRCAAGIRNGKACGNCESIARAIEEDG